MIILLYWRIIFISDMLVSYSTSISIKGIPCCYGKSDTFIALLPKTILTSCQVWLFPTGRTERTRDIIWSC